MNRLVTLTGKHGLGAPQYQFSLFSLGGTSRPDILDINPLELSDIDAGIQILYAMALDRPGLRWKDITDLRMGRKWYERWIGDPASDLIDWTGGVYSAIGDKSGEWAGSAIRLLTEEEVMEGVSRYAMAYGTGGQSEGIMGMLQGLGAGADKGALQKLLANFGKQSKSQVKAASAGNLIQGVDNKVLMIAGAGLLGMLLIFNK